MTGWTIAAFTHRGRVRPANEDAIAVSSRVLTGDMSSPVVMTTPGNGCLLMVADGMGGHAQGAMASRAVLDHLVAVADRLSNSESCAEAIEDANRHLYAQMQQHEAALGMGTTLVGAFLTPAALLTFNVGDSRLLSRGYLAFDRHERLFLDSHGLAASCSSPMPRSITNAQAKRPELGIAASGTNNGPNDSFAGATSCR